MTYEGFTSPASSALWKALLGSEPRKFFGEDPSSILVSRREFMYLMWTEWLARRNLGRILGPPSARILGFFTLQDLVAKNHVPPGTPHLTGNFCSVAEDNASFAFHVCKIPLLPKTMGDLDSPSEKVVGVWGLFPSKTTTSTTSTTSTTTTTTTS